ncbi:MAG TPA: hypothetical protein VN025_00295 [Candidatus Dormibacteraeota bacterium]|jgi:hypothetical protein|nr:hypothetical protein [Candidatus Dormibacteraeota bacterium]
MSPQFHIDLGPFSFSVNVDSNGISTQRGLVQKVFAWDSIQGALLVRPKIKELEEENLDIAKASKFLGGAVDMEKVREMRSQMAIIHIGYRDERKHLKHELIPIPIADDSFLQEFRAHLGNRWLGEAADQQEAEKKLRTAPGFFKTVFVLFVLLGVVALLGAFGLYSLLGPALNVFSLRQMYFDLQSGDWVSFGMHSFIYVVLFAMGYVLRRLWRNYRESKRARLHPFVRQ